MRETRNDPVPLHLRNAPTGLMRGLGYGKDYHYAHDDYDADQTFLPDNLAGRTYYVPGERGDEARSRGTHEKKAARVTSNRRFPLLLLGVCALELRTR